MRPRIKINGTYLTHVYAGDGFFDALRAPLEAKDYIKNESRLENGIRVLASPIKYKARSLVLEFHVFGDSDDHDLSHWLGEFLDAITANNGVNTLGVEGYSSTHTLKYTGKSPSYKGGLSGDACKIKIGFDEIAPTQ